LSEAFFLVGSLAWLSLAWAFYQWESAAEREFLALYHDRIDPGVLTWEAFAAGQSKSPFQMWRLLPRARILWTRQKDQDVERARRRVTNRWFVSLGVTFLGAFIPIILSSIAR
jgi:hypothetical protein